MLILIVSTLFGYPPDPFRCLSSYPVTSLKFLTEPFIYFMGYRLFSFCLPCLVDILCKLTHTILFTQMVFISILCLPRRFSMPAMFTNSFKCLLLLFSVYFDLIPHGLMTPFSFQKCLILMSLPEQLFYVPLPFILRRLLVSILYFLLQLHRVEYTQFLVLFSS